MWNNKQIITRRWTYRNDSYSGIAENLIWNGQAYYISKGVPARITGIRRIRVGPVRIQNKRSIIRVKKRCKYRTCHIHIVCIHYRRKWRVMRSHLVIVGRKRAYNYCNKTCIADQIIRSWQTGMITKGINPRKQSIRVVSKRSIRLKS